MHCDGQVTAFHQPLCSWIIELSFDSSWLLVGSWVFCKQIAMKMHNYEQVIPLCHPLSTLMINNQTWRLWMNVLSANRKTHGSCCPLGWATSYYVVHSSKHDNLKFHTSVQSSIPQMIVTYLHSRQLESCCMRWGEHFVNCSEVA